MTNPESPCESNSSRMARVALAKDRAFAELAGILNGRGWGALSLREQYRALPLAGIITMRENSRDLLPIARQLGLIED